MSQKIQTFHLGDGYAVQFEMEMIPATRRVVRLIGPQGGQRDRYAGLIQMCLGFCFPESTAIECAENRVEPIGNLILNGAGPAISLGGQIVLSDDVAKDAT